MSELRQLLNNYGLNNDLLDIDKLLNNFHSEMNAGLNRKKSSLAMLNSYLSLPKVWSDETVAIIDAGGTNLRIGLGTLKKDKTIKLHNFTKIEMPGKQKEESPITFFNIITDVLHDYKNDFKKIGFCFSYPTEIMPNKDGRLLYWTKEIKIPKLVGCNIGQSLNSSLCRKKMNDKKITILNDTVATLLSGYSIGEKLNISNYVGFILGTGTNTSCIINDQIFNIESGGFSKFPILNFDNDLDKHSENQGYYRFEKAIAGAYLGTLTLRLLQRLALDNLLSTKAQASLLMMHELSTYYFSELVNGDVNDNNIFFSEIFSDIDREIIISVFEIIIERASIFAAVNIASAVLYSNRCSDDNVCITIDGSTCFKTPKMYKQIKDNLNNILQMHNINFKLVEVDDAPAIGAALAAIS